MTMTIRPSSVVRAVGPALAALMPRSRAGLTGQVVALAVTDAAARQIDPHGIGLVTITPDKGKSFTPAQEIASRALPTAIWVVLWLFLERAVAKLPVPRLLRAPLVGGTLYVLDGVMSDLVARAESAASSVPDDGDGPEIADAADSSAS